MPETIQKLFSENEIDSLYVENPTPLYHRIYSLLKSRILNGAINHGAQMPTEQQLSKAFEVSRITAKRAMDELAAENLIVRRRGKGSHVIHECKLHSNLEGNSRASKLSNMSLGTKVRVLDTAVLKPPFDIVSSLGLGNEDLAHRVIRLRCSIEGQPFAYSVSWTRGQQQGFSRENLEARARYDIMEEAGIRVVRIEQQLTATAATEEVAVELGIKTDDPLLTLVRNSFLNDGTVIDILISHFNPENYHYCTTFSLEDFRRKSKKSN